MCYFVTLGIASKYTSFIAVDSQSNAEVESKHMLRRHVPSKLPHGNAQFRLHQPMMFGSTVTNSAFGLFGSAASKPPQIFRSAKTTETSGTFGATTLSSQLPQMLASFRHSNRDSVATTLFGQCASPYVTTPTQGFSTTSFKAPSFNFLSSVPTEQIKSVTANFNQTTEQETDKLYQIISFQSFDGSFIWDSNLIQILELTFDAVKQGMQNF